MSAPLPVAGDTGTPTEDLIERLRRTVPEAFRDGAFDVDALMEQLGACNEDISDERYTFSWNGRSAAVANALAPSRATLAPATDVAGSAPTSDNVFIEGDNLEVLKVLRRSYTGRFKLIYIDPPYNTGKDFVYRDDSTDPLGSYLLATGQADEAGSLLVANPEGHGRYHSRWLTMMYPRLRVARELLREDGVFVAAIGDEEVHHLRLLLDDIFGPENRVGTMVWEGGRKNDAKFISVGHDYMLVYARDVAELKRADRKWGVRKQGLDAIYAEVDRLLDEHGDDYVSASAGLKAWYRSLPKDQPALANKHYSFIDHRGVYFPGDISWPGGGGPKYDVEHPDTKQQVKVPSGGWRISDPDEMQRLIDDRRIHFGADESTVPNLKRYLRETEYQVPASVLYKDRRAATNDLAALMGAKVFDFPKDPEVLQTLIEAATGGGDLVLDFFAGSGSTAEAVMRQNRKDEQRRRFVLATLPEPLNDKTETGKNALKAGYSHIAELSMERVRRVGAKLAAEEGKHAGEDLGFRAYRLAEPLHAPFSAHGDASDVDAAMEQMALAVEPVAADADPDRLLVEVILREGFSLTAKTEGIEGLPNRVHRVIDRRPETTSDQMLLVCLDEMVAAGLSDELPRAVDGVAASSVSLVCRDDAVSDTTLANLGLACAERGWKLKTL